MKNILEHDVVLAAVRAWDVGRCSHDRRCGRNEEPLEREHGLRWSAKVRDVEVR